MLIAHITCWLLQQPAGDGKKSSVSRRCGDPRQRRRLAATRHQRRGLAAAARNLMQRRGWAALYVARMLDSKEERESALLDVIEESEPTTLLMRCYKRFQYILIQQVFTWMYLCQYMHVYVFTCKCGRAYNMHLWICACAVCMWNSKPLTKIAVACVHKNSMS
jgi:hypothetical protein